MNNLTEEIQKTKCKHDHENLKNAKNVQLNTRIASAVLNRETLKMIK